MLAAKKRYVFVFWRFGPVPISARNEDAHGGGVCAPSGLRVNAYFARDASVKTGLPRGRFSDGDGKRDFSE